jgi:acetyl esterase/lipase
VGHSAGGHLALWAASRERLPPGAPGALEGAPPVLIGRAVSMAGVCDLAGGFRDWHGGAVLGLMGASPERAPERYAAADPAALVPLAIPVLLVHGVPDETVSVRLSRDYAAASREAGGDVTLVEIEGHEGRHRAHVYATGEAWRAVLQWLQSERASSTSSRTPYPEAPLPT